MTRKTRFLLDSKGAPILRRRPRADDDDWEEDEFEDDWDEELGDTGYADSDNDPVAIGVCAVDTGILNASGQPIIRHPLRVKLGFRRPDDAYHAPTLDSDAFGEGSIVGWVYDI
jgi:hypothetical protein